MTDDMEYKRRFLLFVKAIEVQDPEEFINQDDKTLKDIGMIINHYIQEAFFHQDILEKVTAKLEFENLDENKLN